jgi:hypothetical protein
MEIWRYDPSTAWSERLHGRWPVYATYTVEGEYIRPKGKVQRWYTPGDHPELPAELARVSWKNTDQALAFVVRYGLLEWDEGPPRVQITAPRPRPKQRGDFLYSVWLHASRVARCLCVTHCLQQDNLPGVRAALELWDDSVPVRHGLNTPAAIRAFALDWRRRMLNECLIGLSPCVYETETEGQERYGLQFPALIQVVYWHLAIKIVGDAPVQHCAEPGCQAWFIQSRRNQRYCPHPDGDKKKSRCAIRAGVRAFRAKRHPQNQGDTNF